MSAPWSEIAPPRKANYKVRFRHGVYPDLESQATRADIKKYDYFFGAAQRWVGTPETLNFVDESSLVAEEFENPGGVDRRKTPKHLTRSKTAARIPGSASRKSPLSRDRRIHPTSAAPADRVLIPAVAQSVHDPWQLPSHIRRHTSPAPGSVSSLSSLDDPLPGTWHSGFPSPHPYIPTDHSSLVPWPIPDPIEAYLFRFWVEKASESLDITSPASVFKKTIPKLALKSPILMNAIFMISGQCILRFDPYFLTRPYDYHERLLESLIPYIAEKGRIEDEATLVAAMLLRNFEDFHAGTRGQSHLSTFELFYGPKGWAFDMSSPVVQAALVLHVHSEVSQALLNQASLRIDYECFILPALISPVDEVSWSNRILWLSARVLQWAQRGMRTMAEWQYLRSLVDEWEQRRPASFDAFFYQGGDTETMGGFPELWFSGACHADANQHLRICRIALAVYNPGLDTQDTRGIVVADSAYGEVLRGLREMIAIARCNAHCISAQWKAAYTVHKFGTVLKEDQDRCQVIGFLGEVQATGMPTHTSVEYLKEQWNWGWNRYEGEMNQF